jgi:hypothetical protein
LTLAHRAFATAAILALAAALILRLLAGVFRTFFARLIFAQRAF